MIHNEDSRVKIPLTIHMLRLGYKYVSKKNSTIDKNTNIFVDIFKNSIEKINKRDFTDEDISRIIIDLNMLLENNDKGKSFYDRLIRYNDIKLIDFENIENNSFNIVTELNFKDKIYGTTEYEEFRPDVNILLNGIPIGFIEVKKPNNKNGIQAEFERMEKRLNKQSFNKFFNMIQIMGFSNNMEYDDTTIAMTQGSFYATPNGQDTRYSFFREQRREELEFEVKVTGQMENEILVDNNMTAIKTLPEFRTNLDIMKPVNDFTTSIFHKSRLMFILKYGIVYVKEPRKAIQKHIIRYPQLFAILKMKDDLNRDLKKGIIWHTQGSGKTSLSAFASKYLKDYFQIKNIITKSYFIVDRIDLLEQSKNEFAYRGMEVDTASSKEEFRNNIKSTQVVKTGSGENGAITVVNIQKFSEESVVESNEYNLNIQRIYFMDEVHRSYNPKGSFLANLFNSDKNAIFIGLTGTPLLKSDYKSTNIFGEYIHKYYYNESIADRYTLRIKREQIETSYKEKFNKLLTDIEVKEGTLTKKDIYESDAFCSALGKYISLDFNNFRRIKKDNSLGCMVVSSSSEQARKLKEWFENYDEKFKGRVALVLFDEGDKQYKKGLQKGFKEGDYDILIVYNMLLTGFDAPRLKKLYLVRLVRSHNLLQTLTRVNRPYKNPNTGELYRHGYIVDFVDIEEEYDKTNQKYLMELRGELGNAVNTVSEIFVDIDKLKEQYQDLQSKLFSYNLNNLEKFQSSISSLVDKNELIFIRKALQELKYTYNELRLSNEDELIHNIDYDRIGKAYKEVDNRIAHINMTEAIESKEENRDIVNMQLENLIFDFIKIKEEELTMVDDLRGIIEKSREEMIKNRDKKDPIYVLLSEELRKILKKINANENIHIEEIYEYKKEFNELFLKARNLNSKNNILLSKYNGDEIGMRIHKRMKTELGFNDIEIYDKILNTKQIIDSSILVNENILENQSYFYQTIRSQVGQNFRKLVGIKNLNFIANEFINEFIGDSNN
ncbi:hypothetical protein B2H97_00770 [Paraclostridium bifermentans]|uniref:DEAD/DEAH box helicase family protein n=1 Tax=Paraclostridium bifermentans TaxID=1490 RepID=UPI000A1785BE|nr:DEAD/DEAH box helicase family protein [Paraclostridium bifermentans]OSB11672.1 hypothetical protein B2H97_00770 [Paraclostridium bifermentans]